ncbi:SDR family NAD(P)-dependent oxidoreductase [Cereibacter sphaeroides]|uniref:SDR family NAD(P)-dependent oxidoreductase n=1 Tax=Cereibacter sphaeroides TaxID=1063 RepID=UPI003FCE9F30
MTGGLLVTGGSGAIGGALCRIAARRRPVWVGYGAGAARARALAAEIAEAGGRAEPVALPLQDPAALEAALAALPEPPASLALCAWPAPFVAPFGRQGEDLALQAAALAGCHALIATAWRLWWRRAGGGHVLAVLSAASEPPVARHMAAYVAQKAALRALLAAAAAELGPAGLRVSVVAPGFVETPMLGAFDPRLLERARADAGGRFLSPERVAQALVAALDAPPPAGTVQDIHLAEEVESDEKQTA